MRNDIDYYYDVTPILDMNHFVELFLVSIALNGNLKEQSLKTYTIANLPVDYKNSIEKIMHSIDTGWAIEFANLIDINFYFETQADWELTFSKAIRDYLKKHYKNVEYDFEFDSIHIFFSQAEITYILNKYDQDCIKKMNHFAKLVLGFSKNRHLELLNKEVSKNAMRKYIRTSASTDSNFYKLDE